jgi:hypothetical protein
MINIKIIHSPGMAVNSYISEISGKTDSIEAAAGLIQSKMMDIDKDDSTDQMDGADIDVLVVITRRECATE